MSLKEGLQNIDEQQFGEVAVGVVERYFLDRGSQSLDEAEKVIAFRRLIGQYPALASVVNLTRTRLELAKPADGIDTDSYSFANGVICAYIILQEHIDLQEQAGLTG